MKHIVTAATMRLDETAATRRRKSPKGASKKTPGLYKTTYFDEAVGEVTNINYARKQIVKLLNDKYSIVEDADPDSFALLCSNPKMASVFVELYRNASLRTKVFAPLNKKMQAIAKGIDPAFKLDTSSNYENGYVHVPSFGYWLKFASETQTLEMRASLYHREIAWEVTDN